MVVVKRWMANWLESPLVYVKYEYKYYLRIGRKMAVNAYYVKINGNIVILGPDGESSQGEWLPFNTKAQHYYWGMPQQDTNTIDDKKVGVQIKYLKALGDVIFWIWVIFTLCLIARHVRW